MEQLGFYPLSVILSFSSEFDGTCLLLTKKFYARQILPIFRLRDNAGLLVVNAPKKRHKYQVFPVQDAAVLLQRLNTRRLGHRQRSSRQLEQQQWKGLSITELADREWRQAEQQFADDGTFQYPPPLELLRFLDKGKVSSNATSSLWHFLEKSGVTLLVSYPRSGNTLLRTLLERTTGIVTGSDTRPDRTLSKALAEAHNLVGEGITQGSKTCFVKTHWPERVGCKVFPGNQIVLIIRNPFDAIDSYWNLNATNTHTETVTDDIYEQHKEMFEGLVKNEIKIWHKFHSFWLETCRSKKLPLLILRFEDLIQNPEREMTRILDFLTKGQSVAPFWKARIRHATATTKSQATLGSYQPRTATTGVKSVGKSIHKGIYSPELIQYIHSAVDNMTEDPDGSGENLLQRFGYDVLDQGFPENFVQGKAPKIADEFESLESCSETASIKVNLGDLVRPKDCPFGRAMRTWRLNHTDNDTNPFPTVPRHSG